MVRHDLVILNQCNLKRFSMVRHYVVILNQCNLISSQYLSDNRVRFQYDKLKRFVEADQEMGHDLVRQAHG